MELYQLFLCYFIVLVIIVYLYLKYIVYNYWKNKGVPQDKVTIPFGNIPFPYFQGKISYGDIFQESYNKFKNHRFHGLYLFYEPILMINDPELIRLILVKNFTKFYNRGYYKNCQKDPLTASLPRLSDDKWKRLRSKLSPTFTSAKLKQMYPLLEAISDELVKALADALRVSDVIEMKELSSRFTTDCISSIAFGFNCNSLQNSEHEFHKYAKISNDYGKVFVLLSFYVPSLMKFYSVPEKRRKIRAFFIDLFEKMVTQRRNGKVERNDFLNMLMQLMDHGKVEGCEDRSVEYGKDKISMMDAVAQAVTFFAAGQETTSSAISFCLYELSLNLEIQEKLREEVDEAFKSSEGMTYENLNDMKYLDMVLYETLRKYPATPVLNRICTEDFHVLNSNFRITKGTRVIVPINCLHYDPLIYPNPEKFDPTRFSAENKVTRHPLTYIPFGEGPRICIGKRLGMLQPKIALCYLLRNYKFFTCNKTQSSMTFKNDIIVQVPNGGVHLKVEKR